MKEKLMKLLKTKEDRKALVLTKSQEENITVEELRALNAEMDSLNKEIRSLQEAVAECDKAPEASERTKAVNAAIPGIVQVSAQTRAARDEDDMEYRIAFMHHVLSRTPIPAELRANATTKTTDVGSAIPVVVVNRILEKMEAIGMILPLVTKTSYAAGMSIPTSTVKPVATWVAEGATSDKQKKQTGSITFTHFKLRCEIAMTMETSVMAVSAFETTFINNVAEAMVKAQEQAILTGAGTASPKGVLAETAVTGQALTATALDYATLVDAEAALPQAYENGARWFMTKKTFMGFVAMVDADGQPIARVNYGIGGKPERYLLGREVVLCGDYLPNFEAAEEGTVCAFLFNPADYVLNANYDMGFQTRQDWDTEDIQSKAVMACDGKVIDLNSLVTIAKDV